MVSEGFICQRSMTFPARSLHRYWIIHFSDASHEFFHGLLFSCQVAASSWSAQYYVGIIIWIVMPRGRRADATVKPMKSEHIPFWISKVEYYQNQGCTVDSTGRMYYLSKPAGICTAVYYYASCKLHPPRLWLGPSTDFGFFWTKTLLLHFSFCA